MAPPALVSGTQPRYRVIWSGPTSRCCGVIAHLESHVRNLCLITVPFVSHVVNLTEAYLQVHEWHQAPGLDACKMGIGLTTGKLLVSRSGYRLPNERRMPGRIKGIGCSHSRWWRR